MAEVNLERVEIRSFLGIDRSRPVLLDLGKFAKKGKNVTLLTGDQQTGKTSTIYGIMALLGANFDFDADNLINRVDNTINEEALLDVDGVKYRVKITKSKFSLEREVDGRWYNEEEPKNTLRQLVGNLGVSPMFLKELSGDKQIEWFQKTFSADEATIKKEKKIREAIKTTKATRTEANRTYTGLKKGLEANELYQNAEENYKRFANPIDGAQLKAELEKVTILYEEYRKAERGLDGIKSQINDVDNDIAELELKLQTARMKRETLEGRKKEGEKYVAENATIQLDYKNAQQAYMDAGKILAEQQMWQTVLQQKEQMDEYETLVIDCDSKKDQLLEDLAELSKKYLPKIKGLKIKIADGEKNDEEGIFYNDKTLAQLSESELWNVFFQIWEQKDVRFVFVENVSSLGTNAVATLNELAAKGVKVFANMMDRKKQTMKITITDKVD